MRIERNTVEQMQATVEDYINERKGVKVTIDIQKEARYMPRRLCIGYFKPQLIKLNLAYTVAKAYLEGH